MELITKAGWLGYGSLIKQGIAVEDFQDYIETNKPLDFTDPEVRSSELTVEQLTKVNIFRLIRLYAVTKPTAMSHSQKNGTMNVLD